MYYIQIIPPSPAEMSTSSGWHFYLFIMIIIMHAVFILSTESTCVAHIPERNIADRYEMNALRAEMQQCTSDVQKLTKEFTEMKKELEAARMEVDTTRCALTEITTKLLAKNY